MCGKSGECLREYCESWALRRCSTKTGGEHSSFATGGGARPNLAPLATASTALQYATCMFQSSIVDSGWRRLTVTLWPWIREMQCTLSPDHLMPRQSQATYGGGHGRHVPSPPPKSRLALSLCHTYTQC